MDIHPRRAAPRRTLITPAESTDAGSGTTEVEVTDTEPMLAPSHKVVIKPLHDDIAPEPEEAAATAAPVAVTESKPLPEPAELPKEAAEPEPKPEAEPAPEPKQALGPEEPEPKPEIPEPASNPEPETAPAPEESKTDDESAEAADKVAEKLRKEHEAGVAKLVQSQKYFVPIQTTKKRRARQALWIVPLIIVLAVAAYDVLLDANIVDNTYDLPHTSWLKSK